MKNDYTNQPSNEPPLSMTVPSNTPWRDSQPVIPIVWPVAPLVVGNVVPISGTGKMRGFETGATRDTSEGKIDYEGCLSPLVLECFGEYMLECSICSDGTKRSSDNWQKGIPMVEYMKSLMRHTWDVWKLHRGYTVNDRITGKPITMKHALCAVMFNVMGYLHEYLKKEV
jgi:hypothetical protein